MNRIIDICQRMINKLQNDKDNSEDKEYRFNKLTSNKNIDLNADHPSFKEALDFAIQDNELKNVAITGNYGSGKSSLLDSYESKCYNKKFLHISLAEYKENEAVEDGKGLNVRQVNVIEGKIINQLLHQINPKYIKKSIFKTLTPGTIGLPVLLTVYVILLSIVLLYFLQPNFWMSLVNDVQILDNILDTIMAWLLLVLVAVGFFVLMKYTIENKSIKSLTISGKHFVSDIEIFSDQSSRVSYFDRYLDDVLYLLEQSKADVIVFEDIDRFDNNSIFEKIKELNVLINNKRKVSKKNKSKLLFLYLIRDDMFISKERTKFFDFIIPVLPVITSSNSNDKLSGILERMGIKSDLTEEFLFRISLYIDDMRLLNNICNEYYSYKIELKENSQKQTLDLDLEKIFAMIVYKNIFPKDFSDLQNNQGFLYKLFNEKENKRRKEIEKIDNDIKQLEEKFKEIQIEHIKDEIELYGTIFKIPNGRQVISVNGKFQNEFVSYYDFISEILDEDSKILSYETFYNAYYNPTSGREETIRSVFPDKDTSDFKERLSNVKSYFHIEEFNRKHDSLARRRRAVEVQLIADTYTNQEIHDLAIAKKFEYVEKNQQFDIIYFLLKNSYIDETYPDYLTYFYENSLTKKDKEFLRNIASGKKTNFDFTLKNLSEVYLRLQTKDFRSPEILNYDLITYILEHVNLSEGEENLKSIILQEDNLDFCIDLAKELYDSNSERYNLDSFTKLMEIWLVINPQRFIDYMISTEAKYRAPLKNNFIRTLMNHVNLNNTSNQIKQRLANYINQNYNLILPSENFTLLFQINLEIINIKFEKFDTFGEPNDGIQGTNTFLGVIDFIFRNNLYIINENNLKFFMRWFKGECHWSEEDFKHKNFEIINTNQNYSPLLKYIEDNVDDYVYAYLDICEGSILDDSEYLSQLICQNSSFESMITIEEMDEDGERIIDEVSQIDKLLDCIPNNSISFSSDDYQHLEEGNYITLVTSLVQKSKAVVNTDIIMSYFNVVQDFDDELVQFINSSSEFEFEKDIFKLFEKEEQRNFFEKTVVCMDLDDVKYEVILRKLDWSYTNEFNLKNIELDKVRILINLEIIKFNSENLQFLRENYPEVVTYLVKTYLSEYLDIEDEIHDEEELLSLLDENDISDDDKCKIADHLLTISVRGKNYSEKLIIYVLTNQFDKEDIGYIIDSRFFDNASSELKNIVEEIVVNNIEEIAESSYDVISNKLVDKLIAHNQTNLSIIKNLLYSYFVYSSNLTLEDKKKYFTKYIDLFTLSKNIKALKELEVFDEWEKTIKVLNKPGYRWKNVSKTSLNQAFANYLDKSDWISSFSDLKDEIRINSFTDKRIPL